MKKSDYIFNEANPARTQLFQEGNMLDADQDGTHNGKPVGLAGDIKRTFRQFDEHDALLGPTHGKPFNFFDTLAGKVVSADEAYTKATRGAGASLSRDAIDTRIMEAVIHRTGSLIDSQDKLRNGSGQLPGIDDLPSTKRPAEFDADNDGMEDKFELEHGLNPHDPADRNGTKLSNDGYTNLEVYLNGLVPHEKIP